MGKNFVYIIQAKKEKSFCKIGITDDLERRLKEYNSKTGTSSNNFASYLFTCEVTDAAAVEKDIKEEFYRLRETLNREIYFYNPNLFKEYVEFIKNHVLFVKEIFIEKKQALEVTKIVKKHKPSLEERGITKTDVMLQAQRVKNDEFYTRYEDVEKELLMYPPEIWWDKTVFCNCDDAVGEVEANVSPFALFFLKNFNKLKLKKLICTHYSGVVDLFHEGTKGYIFTRDGFMEIKHYLDGKKEFPKHYDGSFDHPISKKILQEEADIVCTNPPFSKSKDFWPLLIGSDKRFIVISNFTIVRYTFFIPYLQNKKVWGGYHSVDNYLNPKKELVTAAGHWFTNVPIENRPKHELLKFCNLEEIPEEHKYFDDKGVLIVKKSYIPVNYSKPFGVSARVILNGILEKGYEIFQAKEYRPYLNGNEKYPNVLVHKVKG
ncbi:MAG: GIY-YIG nuclease family protein [Spirochaetaceae bacterium]|nr:GIY-YIG nuclease family protein [Spirochaetaceae bacterium]